MSNNFTSIGFLAETMEDFDDMIGQILDDEDNIQQYDTPAGTYLCWKQDKNFGPEVFIQIVDKQIVCFAPYFRGKSKVPVAFTEQIDIPNPTPLDAYLYGWADPQNDDPESGEYPFVCEMMALLAYGEEEFPYLSDTSICAIAKEVDIYDSEEAYEKATGGDEAPMAPESFIPAGLFPPDEGDHEDFVPEPYAIFTGKILETKEITNKLTRHKFHWALVKTLGGIFDVVIAPQDLNGQLKKDGILQGAFHLTADFKS